MPSNPERLPPSDRLPGMSTGPVDLPHPVTRQLFPSPVPPGTGWPGDPASPTTPVAENADDVVSRAASARHLELLDAQVSVCRACPRLVEWREQVARDKRRASAAEPYWGRPIPGYGSAHPSVLIVGLAPAATGSNRTGRAFTGDMAGVWLFGALYRAGLAVQETSVSAGDGQELIDTRMVSTVRCAPPDNKPTIVERDTCAPWLDAELKFVLPSVKVIICLGSYGWSAAFRALKRCGYAVPRPLPKFGHAARVEVQPPEGEAGGAVVVLGCFHPSQRNTFTGKLTVPMIDAVVGEAAAIAGR